MDHRAGKLVLPEFLLIDDTHPDFPVQPEIQNQMELSDEKRAELKTECLSILHAYGTEVQNADGQAAGLAWYPNRISPNGLNSDSRTLANVRH
jgi:hypothetical protein